MYTPSPSVPGLYDHRARLETSDLGRAQRTLKNSDHGRNAILAQEQESRARHASFSHPPSTPSKQRAVCSEQALPPCETEIYNGSTKNGRKPGLTEEAGKATGDYGRR